MIQFIAYTIILQKIKYEKKVFSRCVCTYSMIDIGPVLTDNINFDCGNHSSSGKIMLIVKKIITQ